MSQRILDWMKHLAYAWMLSSRADYLCGKGISLIFFIIFTAILWYLFSYSDKKCLIKGKFYDERETAILKSLFFSLLVLIYYETLSLVYEDFSWIGIFVWVYGTFILHIIFSRLYRGNWEIFIAKPYSDTLRVLRKLFEKK